MLGYTNLWHFGLQQGCEDANEREICLCMRILRCTECESSASLEAHRRMGSARTYSRSRQSRRHHHRRLLPPASIARAGPAQAAMLSDGMLISHETAKLHALAEVCLRRTFHNDWRIWLIEVKHGAARCEQMTLYHAPLLGNGGPCTPLVTP